ncbi:peroxisomal membrane protein 11C-like isoform X3 [Varroa jacobsoni]|uniref:peroxisomal membrane protein 11C-like isoform X3 n=1 Tax=Varroa jacobsoni TaxID=62625 RepID=UPI000BF2B2DE|nr:peroxisomal membrane protein 11C-like isoform X3 [Varroa jacobsoni]
MIVLYFHNKVLWKLTICYVMYSDTTSITTTGSWKLHSVGSDLLRFVSIVKNIADQVFFLVEHMAWLSDKRVIRFRDTNRLWTTSKFLWAFSLYCGCIKAIRSLKKLGQQQDALRNETTEIRRAKAQHVVALLISSLNLINAISWLPKGVLWAGKLKTWHNGAIGLAASFLSLVQLLTSMN